MPDLPLIESIALGIEKPPINADFRHLMVSIKQEAVSAIEMANLNVKQYDDKHLLNLSDQEYDVNVTVNQYSVGVDVAQQSINLVNNNGVNSLADEAVEQQLVCVVNNNFVSFRPQLMEVDVNELVDVTIEHDSHLVNSLVDVIVDEEFVVQLIDTINNDGANGFVNVAVEQPLVNVIANDVENNSIDVGEQLVNVIDNYDIAVEQFVNVCDDDVNSSRDVGKLPVNVVDNDRVKSLIDVDVIVKVVNYDDVKGSMDVDVGKELIDVLNSDDVNSSVNVGEQLADVLNDDDVNSSIDVGEQSVNVIVNVVNVIDNNNVNVVDIAV